MIGFRYELQTFLATAHRLDRVSYVRHIHSFRTCSSSPCEVMTSTQRWLTSIRARKLCPFAARSLDAGHVRIRVCVSSDLVEVFDRLHTEVDELIESSNNDLNTLLVLSNTLPEFDDFCAFVGEFEESLGLLYKDDAVQVATFHPLYCFAGKTIDDVGNYTNRSPVPIVHLLQKAHVSRALAAFPGDPDKIWRRNIVTFTDIGIDEARRQLNACTKLTGTRENLARMQEVDKSTSGQEI